MAYETGLATSQSDFMGKLAAFAVANGWTLDNHDTVNRRLSLHANNVYVHFRWDDVNNIAIYQSLGYTPGALPNAHPSSANNPAQATGTITTGRYINTIGVGPFVSHHFFADSDPLCLYAVLEFAPGQYHHFGFGEIIKFGDWTGGEFSDCSYWATGSLSDSLSDTNHSVLFDTANSADSRGATMHIEGLPGMSASSKWGVMWNQMSAIAAGTDVAGNPRESLMGPGRSGPWAEAFYKYQTSQQQGYVPLLPMHVFYRNRTTTPQRAYLLGHLPNIRNVNIAAFNPAEEVSLGTDTWVVFPFIRKRAWVNDDTRQSGNGGIAYLKV